jgi:hypothetical protein
MKQLISLVIISFIFISAGCSGYLSNEKKVNDDVSVSKLMLSDGSGYLSDSRANDISPFIYRDTNTGRAWLFFASDRGNNAGTNSIWYAEMDKDGKFFNLRKAGGEITNETNYSMVSPIVYQLARDTNIYFSIVETSLDNPSCRFQSFIIDPVSNNTIYLSTSGSFSPSTSVGWNMGLVQGADLVVMSYGTNWVDILSNLPWYFQIAGTIDVGSVSVSSASGWSDGNSYVLIASSTDGRLGWGYVVPVTNGTNFGPITAYQSAYHDITPFVDYGGNQKVYFASDRSGSYDLYRYNEKTFDKVISTVPEYIPPALEAPLDLYAVMNCPNSTFDVSWSPVPNAAGYQLYASMDSNSFIMITDTPDCFFADTNLNNYYYRVRAYNGTNFSPFSEDVQETGGCSIQFK